MVVNHKVTGRSMTMPSGLAIGWAVSIMITLIGAAISANLIISEKIDPSAIGYSAILILLIASAAGAWLAAKLIKHRWMIVCLSVGGCYYATLLAITALFFGGQYQGMGVTALAVLGGCGAVGLLGLRGQGSGIKKRKIRHFR